MTAQPLADAGVEDATDVEEPGAPHGDGLDSRITAYVTLKK
jgi:hypothetical protein